MAPSSGIEPDFTNQTKMLQDQSQTIGGQTNSPYHPYKVGDGGIEPPS